MRAECDRLREFITAVGLGQESEGVVVVLKPGNSGGAKGPWRIRVFVRSRRGPLEREFHNGRKPPDEKKDWAFGEAVCSACAVG